MIQNHPYQQIKNALPTHAQLVAVSKLQPAEKIRELYQQGQRLFAENYVQEALQKQEELQDLTAIQWHLIGHLQKNKIKQILGRFYLIHSIDSIELLEALQKKLSEKNLNQKILLQVNLSQEETKGGFHPSDLKSVFENCKNWPSLQIIGLMTMPPLTSTPEESRHWFHELRKCRDQWQKMHPPLTELSMGTSGDWPVATEEGATLIRIGTQLFGARPAALK